MTRKLMLRKETLTELATEDLTRVAGASGPTCNTNLCLTACTSCASDFQECYTGGCVTTVLHCPAPSAAPAC